jgi:hypothetical protein
VHWLPLSEWCTSRPRTAPGERHPSAPEGELGAQVIAHRPAVKGDGAAWRCSRARPRLTKAWLVPNLSGRLWAAGPLMFLWHSSAQPAVAQRLSHRGSVSQFRQNATATHFESDRRDRPAKLYEPPETINYQLHCPLSGQVSMFRGDRVWGVGPRRRWPARCRDRFRRQPRGLSSGSTIESCWSC